MIPKKESAEKRIAPQAQKNGLLSFRRVSLGLTFFSIVIPGLFFFFVIPRLDRGICKGDPRDKPEDDRREKRGRT